MEVQFVDRILTCSDCHSEFIFTAGEQLFFHDKQFKNDPKRCKPCKSRRSGLAAGANATGPAAAGLSRTETRTECSECGVPTTVPFKPTQGRPVLCRQCFQAHGKAVLAAASLPAEVPFPQPISANETVSQLSAASAEANGAMISVESAVGAAASMAGASPLSSVASAADLASITEMEATPAIPSIADVPTELLAAANAAGIPLEQIAAMVETSDA